MELACQCRVNYGVCRWRRVWLVITYESAAEHMRVIGPAVSVDAANPYIAETAFRRSGVLQEIEERHVWSRSGEIGSYSVPVPNYNRRKLL